MKTEWLAYGMVYYDNKTWTITEFNAILAKLEVNNQTTFIKGEKIAIVVYDKETGSLMNFF
jgi:hypothetical protein